MPIKVLNLISSPYGHGGAEKLLLDMAELFDRNTFSVSYCNLFDPPNGRSPFSTKLRERELSVFEIDGHRWHDIPKIITRLRDLIKANKIDIVHSHLFHASMVASVAGRLESENRRTVITQHYTRSALGKRYQKKLDRFAVRAADRVIAISSAVRSDLIFQGVNENNIEIIPNGIDFSKFDEDAKKENHVVDLLKDQGKFIVGSVGNLHKRKDHRTLILAMEQVVRYAPSVHMVIVGEGAERAELEKLIRARDLETRVSLLGFQNDIPSLISKFDLYVHPSLYEPFGIAILEAMAARIPVIATKVDGVVDIIDDGINGFLVPAQDPQTIARAVRKAVSDPDANLEIALRGRERVERDFGIEKTTLRYQTLYADVVASSVNL